MDMVRLSVPGTLLYRDLVLRVVASVCRLLRSGVEEEQEASQLRHVPDFDDKVVSAVSEAFNNVATHAYAGSAAGNAHFEFRVDGDRLTVRISDSGGGFNLSVELGRSLETMRESHMGLVIMRECMDELSYSRGEPPQPNILTMTKHYFVRDAASGRSKTSG
jgi:anti-sigma regulatory factor (Ser/Thr protein kinase)